MQLGNIVHIKKNGAAGTKYPFSSGSDCVIGSGLDCHVRLQDLSLSESQVCAIKTGRNGKPFIQKISRAVPISVNGVELKGTKTLQTGDVIEFGGRKFKWEEVLMTKTPGRLLKRPSARLSHRKSLSDFRKLGPSKPGRYSTAEHLSNWMESKEEITSIQVSSPNIYSSDEEAKLSSSGSTQQAEIKVSKTPMKTTNTSGKQFGFKIRSAKKSPVTKTPTPAKFKKTPLKTPNVSVKSASTPNILKETKTPKSIKKSVAKSPKKTPKNKTPKSATLQATRSATRSSRKSILPGIKENITPTESGPSTPENGPKTPDSFILKPLATPQSIKAVKSAAKKDASLRKSLSKQHNSNKRKLSDIANELRVSKRIKLASPEKDLSLDGSIDFHPEPPVLNSNRRMRSKTLTPNKQLGKRQTRNSLPAVGILTTQDRRSISSTPQNVWSKQRVSTDTPTLHLEESLANCSPVRSVDEPVPSIVVTEANDSFTVSKDISGIERISNDSNLNITDVGSPKKSEANITTRSQRKENSVTFTSPNKSTRKSKSLIDLKSPLQKSTRLSRSAQKVVTVDIHTPEPLKALNITSKSKKVVTPVQTRIILSDKYENITPEPENNTHNSRKSFKNETLQNISNYIDVEDSGSKSKRVSRRLQTAENEISHTEILSPNISRNKSQNTTLNSKSLRQSAIKNNLSSKKLAEEIPETTDSESTSDLFDVSQNKSLRSSKRFSKKFTDVTSTPLPKSTNKKQNISVDTQNLSIDFLQENTSRRTTRNAMMECSVNLTKPNNSQNMSKVSFMEKSGDASNVLTKTLDNDSESLRISKTRPRRSQSSINSSLLSNVSNSTHEDDSQNIFSDIDKSSRISRRSKSASLGTSLRDTTLERSRKGKSIQNLDVTAKSDLNGTNESLISNDIQQNEIELPDGSSKNFTPSEASRRSFRKSDKRLEIVLNKSLVDNRSKVSETTFTASEKNKSIGDTTDNSVIEIFDSSTSQISSRKRKRSSVANSTLNNTQDLTLYYENSSSDENVKKKAKSPQNDLSDVKYVKRLFDAKSPRNDYTKVVGLKKIFGTPRERKSPRNDLSDVRGLRSMFKTSGGKPKTPKNDLTDVRGVKKLLEPEKSPKNDLTNVSGMKTLFKTPKEQKSPLNDLSDLRGVRNMYRTSGKKMKSPKNDLTKIVGVKTLFKTPKEQKSPRNDLSDVRGLRKMYRTPGRKLKSPKNDLTDVGGVKKMFNTPKQQKSPKNDLSDVRGVKNLIKTPKEVRAPKNDLTDVQGVKELVEGYRKKGPKNDLTDVRGVERLFRSKQKSPKNDLTNVSGVKRVLRTPRAVSSPANDLSDVTGVRKMFASTSSPRNDLRDVAGVKRMFGEASTSNTYLNVSNVDVLFDELKYKDASAEEFNIIEKIKRSPVRTYERKAKTMTPQNQEKLSKRNVSLHENDKEPVHVAKWIEEQREYMKNKNDDGTERVESQKRVSGNRLLDEKIPRINHPETLFTETSSAKKRLRTKGKQEDVPNEKESQNEFAGVEEENKPEEEIVVESKEEEKVTRTRSTKKQAEKTEMATSKTRRGRENKESLEAPSTSRTTRGKQKSKMSENHDSNDDENTVEKVIVKKTTRSLRAGKKDEKVEVLENVQPLLPEMSVDESDIEEEGLNVGNKKVEKKVTFEQAETNVTDTNEKGTPQKTTRGRRGNKQTKKETELKTQTSKKGKATKVASTEETDETAQRSTRSRRNESESKEVEDKEKAPTKSRKKNKSNSDTVDEDDSNVAVAPVKGRATRSKKDDETQDMTAKKETVTKEKSTRSRKNDESKTEPSDQKVAEKKTRGKKNVSSKVEESVEKTEESEKEEKRETRKNKSATDTTHSSEEVATERKTRNQRTKKEETIEETEEPPKATKSTRKTTKAKAEKPEIDTEEKNERKSRRNKQTTEEPSEEVTTKTRKATKKTDEDAQPKSNRRRKVEEEEDATTEPSEEETSKTRGATKKTEEDAQPKSSRRRKPAEDEVVSTRTSKRKRADDSSADSKAQSQKTTQEEPTRKSTRKRKGT